MEIRSRVQDTNLVGLIHVGIIASVLVTFGIGIFALTLEADEIWILMSTMKAFGIPLPPTSAIDQPVTTTGGIHTIVHGLIALGWGKSIYTHRIVSVIFTLALLGLVFKIIDCRLNDRILAFAGTALFCIAPGFLLQASLATAEVIATTIFLIGVIFWVRYGSQSWIMAMVGGTMFGVACATRMTCLSLLPAILVWSVLAREGWKGRLIYPSLGIGTALLVYIASLVLYYAAFNNASWGPGLIQNVTASGFARPYLGLMMRLNYLVTADAIVPVAALTVLGGWMLKQLEGRTLNSEAFGICWLLFLAGSAGWLAWLLKAPIPHIRYLWPAIPMLWLAAILLVLTALKRVTDLKTRSIAHLIIFVTCSAQVLINVRSLAIGDSLALIYEAARMQAHGDVTPFFTARNSQQEMADRIKALGPTATIFALSERAAYPMTYLTGRAIKAFEAPMQASNHDYLLVLPYDKNKAVPTWRLIGWIQNNATLIGRNGEYQLYQLKEKAALPLPL